MSFDLSAGPALGLLETSMRDQLNIEKRRLEKSMEEQLNAEKERLENQSMRQQIANQLTVQKEEMIDHSRAETTDLRTDKFGSFFDYAV